MTNKKNKGFASNYVPVVLLFLILIIGAVLLFTYSPTPENGDEVTPPPVSETVMTYKGELMVDWRDDIIIDSSPLVITGKARGTWFFEGDFPVKLFDGTGNLLTAVPAQAQDEWMTEDFVPFKAELEFELPLTDTGILVLEKDNPSGLPEHADEFQIPVRFKSQETERDDFDDFEERGASEIIYTSEELSKEIAENFVTSQAPTYLFDGMNLELIESRALDLAGCEECYEFEFSFDSRHSGYGDRAGEALAQVITPHTIVVTVEFGEVAKAITDGKYDEINEEFLE